MKLFVSPTSPYARKARVLVRELDLLKQVEEVMVDPWTDASLRAVNPLGKIPALILADGSAIYDSPVICEYLDEFAHGPFFPRPTLLKAAEGKWRALTLQALADGLCDAVVRRYVEMKLPEEARNRPVLLRQEEAVGAALGLLERAAPKFKKITIGEVAAGCALGYLDLRWPALAWRATHPALAAWFATFSQYGAMKATEPPQ